MQRLSVAPESGAYLCNTGYGPDGLERAIRRPGIIGRSSSVGAASVHQPARVDRRASSMNPGGNPVLYERQRTASPSVDERDKGGYSRHNGNGGSGNPSPHSGNSPPAAHPEQQTGGDEAANDVAPGSGNPSPQQCLKPRVHPVVSNAYSIGNLLGSGAFGTVWMAQHRGTGNRVAIKIVERQRQLHEDFRLEPAEAEILKTVSHPSIVKLLDFFSSEQCVYLVMEIVMGGHLQSRLQNHGHYDEPKGRLVLAQVVEAVHHLHDKSIIHRDIKPENILFAEHLDDVSVKLTDFGLSTMKEGTRLTTRCGTPSYCAPELLSGEGYGKAVDMWSLGVLAYVLLYGVLPFVASDRPELFKRIQKGHYVYPEDAKTSMLARDLISRLLRLAPMERYSTRETLQHPWLIAAGEAAGDEQSDRSSAEQPYADHLDLDTVHEMMRRFNAERRLRRAGLVVMACSRFRRAAERRLAAEAEAAAAAAAAAAVAAGAAAAAADAVEAQAASDAGAKTDAESAGTRVEEFAVTGWSDDGDNADVPPIFEPPPSDAVHVLSAMSG